MSLFKTKEYKALEAIQSRRTEKNTLKNACYFELYKIRVAQICDEKHPDLGYAWLSRLNQQPVAEREFTESEFSHIWGANWPEDGELDIESLERDIKSL